ncbi:MAG: DUF11 domain-containing protein, partial [Bacteroidetes bacterium]
MSAQVTVTVYQDYNDDGIRQLNAKGLPGSPLDDEIGVPGLTVIAYETANGLGTPLTLTDNGDGTYTLPSGNTGPFRIEIDLAGSTYQPGVSGQTTVLFADNGDNLEVGINALGDYCDQDPIPMFVSCFTRGELNGPNDNDPALLHFEYGQTGTGIGTPFAEFQDVGATWGLTHDNANKVLYAATLGRYLSAIGPDGYGAVYRYDVSNLGSITALASLDLSNAMPISTVPRAYNLNANSARDPDMFTEVGQIAFGDIEASADGDTLWVANLSNQTVYQISGLLNVPLTPGAPIDITGVSGVVVTALSTGISGPCGSTPGDDYAIWAIEKRHGRLYVGVVCTGLASGDRTDLRADVLEWNPVAGSWSSIIGGSPSGIALHDFYKGSTYDSNSSSQSIEEVQWNAWTNDFSDIVNSLNPSNETRFGYPTPMLVDIEFDVDGSLILGFIDRTAFQTGRRIRNPQNNSDNREYLTDAGGDILRLCRVGAGYVREGDAGCPSNFSNPISTSQFPVPPGTNEGPGNGEYYDDQSANSTHDDNSFGALALVPGKGEVLATGYAVVQDTDMGVVYFNNATGARDAAAQISPSRSNAFSKAAGFGDIEVGCPLPGIEIGNRIWFDDDQDGVQDPGVAEAGINGVTVQLYIETSPGSGTYVLSAQTVTSGDGNYLFSNNSDPNQTWFGGQTAIQPNTNYQIRVAQSSVTAANAMVQALTSADATGNNTNNNITDLSDSDASLDPGNVAIISFTTGILGMHNHTLDMGWIASPPCAIDQLPTVTGQCRTNGTPADPNDDRIRFVINVTGVGVSASGYVISATQGGSPVTLNVTTGNYNINRVVLAAPGTASNGNLTVTIMDADDPACQMVFTVTDPGTCSNNTCALGEENLTNVMCNNDGTADPSDDYITFSLQPTGSFLGPSYTLTATQGGSPVAITGGSVGSGNQGSYAMVENFQLAAGTAGGGPISVTITDDNDPACTLMFEIINPGSCSCIVPDFTLGTTSCVDNGTSNDPGDDRIVFTLNMPAGSLLTGTYSVSVVGTTVNTYTGMVEGSANGVTYGTSQDFILGPGTSGSGDYVITITDDTDNSCTQELIVSNPATCSPDCNLLSPGLLLVRCVDRSVVNENNPADDRIQIRINPTGNNLGANGYTISATQNGLPITQVAIGGVVGFQNLPYVLPYGMPSRITFGHPINSPTAGNGDIVVTLTDVDDPACSLVFTVPDPGRCSPLVVITKDVASVTPAPGDTYDVVYTISVDNIGGAVPTSYSLVDTPGFDDDVSINSATFTTDATDSPANPGPVDLYALSPTGPWTLADNLPINVGESFTYTVTVNVSLDVSAGSPGDNTYTACGTATPGTPVSGEGLFNEVSLDVGANGTIETTAAACDDIPLPRITHRKDMVTVSPVPNADGTYTVTYTVVVENQGGASDTYDLIDTPSFDDDIVIHAASYSTMNVVPVVAGGALSLINNTPNTLADDINIGAGVTHTYTLTYRVELALAPGSTDGGDNIYTNCGTVTATPGPTTTDASVPGQGLYNATVLDTNNDGVPEEEDEICADLPYITHEKTGPVISAQLMNGSYDVTYTVTVRNLGGAAGEYDLYDTPGFDDDFIINTADFTSVGTSGPLMGGLSLTNNVTNILASDESIAAGATHTYSLSFNVTLLLGAPGTTTGDGVYSSCGSSIPGEINPGEGLYNATALDLNNDNVPEEEDEVCGDIPLVSVGSTVFLDEDNDGFQDSDEPGIAGVVIQLFDDENNLIATDTTDSNGDYFFGGLPEGDYYLVIPASENFGGGDALENTDLSSVPTDNNDNQEDEDDNGIQTGGQGTDVVSPVFNLTADAEPENEVGQGGTQDSADDNNGDMTIDFGFVPINFDLALLKQLAPGQPASVEPGDTVYHQITVINQGNLAADNIEVTDYIPANMTFETGNNPDWLPASDVAGPGQVTLLLEDFNGADNLAIGASITVDIALTINSPLLPPGTILRNEAEISEATDEFGNPQDDIDSTPDNNDTNDNELVDNDVNGDANDGGDEDDHDWEEVVIQGFDLALIKLLADDQPAQVRPGDTLHYRIRVINQGMIAADNIEVIDYLPADGSLYYEGGITGNDDAGWNGSGGDPVRTLSVANGDIATGGLAPGDSIEVSI